MKKFYCRPEIREIKLIGVVLAGLTDSTGVTKRGFDFDSRQIDFDEEEDKRSIWDE